MDILILLLFGAVAGWLGSVIYKGSGLGLIGNIVVGIIGSYVGNWAFTKLNISLGTGLVGTLLTAAAGAIIILVIVNLIFGIRR